MIHTITKNVFFIEHGGIDVGLRKQTIVAKMVDWELRAWKSSRRSSNSLKSSQEKSSGPRVSTCGPKMAGARNGGRLVLGGRVSRHW